MSTPIAFEHVVTKKNRLRLTEVQDSISAAVSPDRPMLKGESLAHDLTSQSVPSSDAM